MAIYALTGRPRVGKTYYIASQVPRWLKDKRRVFSNFKLNLGVGALKKFSESIVGDIKSEADRNNPAKLLFYWRNINEWNLMSNGVIICDEGTRYFNPRKWEQLSEDTEIKLQQHGKEDLDIWVSVQHYSRLDVTLRVLVERFLDVKRILGWGNKTFIFRVAELYLEEMERYERLGKEYLEAQNVWTEWHIIWKKYCIIYDTKASVGRSEPMPLLHITRTCPTCGKQTTKHY